MSMYSDSLRAFLRPILPFLDDQEVTEIMINGPADIWIERGGKVFKTEAFFSEEGLLAATRNMAQFVGRVLSDERPRLDARLPDGSRIHIVMPPVARKGATVAIRKFAKDKLSMQRLIEVGSSTPPLARLIEAAVRCKLNIVVSGGTGSGKTSLLNVLSRYIPEEERILTIEDSAELQMQQPHIVSFESRPADKFGKGEVTMGDLLNSALRLRPDRIVVGEVRGGECFYLLQAMNTGHGGSLATTHANTPTDTLRRLESLCLMSGVELPMVAIRAQVASAINLIVCCERFSDGSRKITHVAEVLPLNDRGDYRTQDLYVFTATGKHPVTGKVEGYHAPTGILPTFLPRLKAAGITDLDERFFDPATYKVAPPPVFHADEEFKTRWAPSLRHRESESPAAIAAVEAAAAQLAPAPAAEPAPAQPRFEDPARLPGASLTDTTPGTPGDEPAAMPRARDPEPTEVPASALTDDTPRRGLAAPFELDEDTRNDEAPKKPDDTDPRIQQAAAQAKAQAEEEHDGVVEEIHEEPAPVAAKAPSATKTPAGAVPAPVVPPPVRDEPTIQISDDLLEEVERVVVNEATYVKRNPLLDKPVVARPAPAAVKPLAPASKPPAGGVAIKVQQKPAAPGAPARKRQDEDEKTDPHIRIPTK